MKAMRYVPVLLIVFLAVAPSTASAWCLSCGISAAIPSMTNTAEQLLIMEQQERQQEEQQQQQQQLQQQQQQQQQQQAALTDPVAQYNLGLAWYQGQGVARNYDQAMQWWRKAADLGYANGQFGVGLLYEHGYGVPQDYAQAMYWFRKAAAQGNADAQDAVGVSYENGWFGSKDYGQARNWYNLAIAQGNDAARKNLATLPATPAPQSMDGNVNRAIEALTKAYPNWREIVGAVDSQGRFDPNNPFRAWLSKQPEDYQRTINGSNNAPVIIAAINKFQTDQAKAAASTSRSNDTVSTYNRCVSAAYRAGIVPACGPRVAIVADKH